ncbi:MAG: hypothetical protein AABX82_06815 [Nanoarchaeota archaeon]
MKGFFVFGSPAITLSIKDKQVGISDYLMASGEGRVTNVYKGQMELFHNCKILIERHKRIVEITKTG